jgi:hypothetical protein
MRLSGPRSLGRGLRHLTQCLRVVLRRRPDVAALLAAVIVDVGVLARMFQPTQRRGIALRTGADRHMGSRRPIP